MRELTGAPVAKSLMNALSPEIEALAAANILPKLAVVRIGAGRTISRTSGALSKDSRRRRPARR
jgi:hypothetical protein